MTRPGYDFSTAHAKNIYAHLVLTRVFHFVPLTIALFTISVVHAESSKPVATSTVAAPEWDPGPRWGVSLGAGLAAGSFHDSSFSRQLTNAGFEGNGPGFHLHMPLEIDVRLFTGLALGVAFDMQFGSISSENNERSHGFHTLNALFLVRPSFQMMEPGKSYGGLVGLDLGIGGGTALWVVRDEIEAAPSYRFRTNLVISYVQRGFGAGFRIGVQFSGAGPFGPLGLRMTDWSSFLEPRLEWRW